MQKQHWEIRPLRADDRADWEPLARGYKAFYEVELEMSAYDLAWQRLLDAREIHGLAAVQGGRVLGLAHFLFHTSIWTGDACYLQDLFVAEAARGQGAARALIEAVAACARAQGATRFHWLTHQGNRSARMLYDSLGVHTGIIRYDYPMG